MRISDWSSDVCSSDLFDHIVCESTYGDQTRKQYTIRQRRTLLQGEIREAIAAGGNLVIPVFALERTQELQIGRAHVELQSLMRISYAVFCLKKKKRQQQTRE